ncbi:MAG: hypothetical protein AB8B61_10435 [Cyclobacteriaceae bacterium]
MSKKEAIKAKIIEKKVVKVKKSITKTNNLLGKLGDKLKSEERVLKSLAKDKKVKKSKFARQTKLVSKLEAKIKKVKSLKKEKKKKLEILNSKLGSKSTVEATPSVNKVEKVAPKKTTNKKIVPVKKTATKRKTRATNTSSDFGFKEAIAKIRTLTTVSAIDKFTEGEKRATVLTAIKGRKNRVKK